MVKRYDPDVTMSEIDDGDYVWFEDYEKLKASHDKLKKYIVHATGCNLNLSDEIRKTLKKQDICTCGLDQALKEANVCKQQS